jgi:steroid delta-isomerase-like uncharacterized protein
VAQTETTQRQELDQAWVDEFAERWKAAWNSHQPDRVLELMTEDIVYDDSAWPTTMRGHGDVRQFLEFAWTAFPDLSFEPATGPFIMPGEPRAAFEWTASATHTGPMDPPGYAPTGKRIEFGGADFHEYRDGRICRLRIVVDMMDLGRQLGLLPPAGSPLEQAGAAVQRLAMKVREQLQR